MQFPALKHHKAAGNKNIHTHRYSSHILSYYLFLSVWRRDHASRPKKHVKNAC